MTPAHSIPTLVVSLALLGLVTWMAASYSDGGRLLAPGVSQGEVRAVAQTAPDTLRSGEARLAPSFDAHQRHRRRPVRER
jgi:hypothetical protein